MATSPLSSLIAAHRATLSGFRRDGKTTVAMEHLLSKWADTTETYVRRFLSLPPREREAWGPQVLASYMLLEKSVAALGGNQIAIQPLTDVLRQSISRILGGGYQVESLTITSPVPEGSLQCDVEVVDHEVGFVLVLATEHDYSRHPLLPRVVHEAAHADPRIREMVQNPWLHNRWLGEACCDMVGTLLGGPAFPASSVALTKVVGADVARRSDVGHPSLAARNSLLGSLVHRLWGATRLNEVAETLETAMQDVACLPEEMSSREQLRDELLALLPIYEALMTDVGVWEAMYVHGVDPPNSSPLIAMNSDFAQEYFNR